MLVPIGVVWFKVGGFNPLLSFSCCFEKVCKLHNGEAIWFVVTYKYNHCKL
jgi:hypothetical protein